MRKPALTVAQVIERLQQLPPDSVLTNVESTDEFDYLHYHLSEITDRGELRFTFGFREEYEPVWPDEDDNLEGFALVPTNTPPTRLRAPQEGNS